MTDLTPDLQFLVGGPVNAIHFVMAYVEVHFNGSYLRCLSPPVVRRNGATFAFPGPGWRDALCELIEAEVLAIRAVAEGELHVTFSDGATLTSSLSGPGEALHFHDRATQETQYW